MDRLERRRVDPLRVGEDLLEHLPHLQTVGVALVVEDVAAGEGGVGQVPDEHLLAQVERLEAVGVELGDGGVADALEEVRALVGLACGRGSGTLGPPRGRALRRRRGQAGDRNDDAQKGDGDDAQHGNTPRRLRPPGHGHL